MINLANPSNSALLQRMTLGSLLTAATVLGSLALACAMPFAGLAALAVLFLPRRDAYVLIGVNWLANQLIGFALLHYPMTGAGLVAGLGLGVACFGGVVAGAFAADRLCKAVNFPLAALGTLAATFAAYEGLCFLTSIGHHDGDFVLSVQLYVLYLNGLAFAGLLAVQTIAQFAGLVVPSAVRHAGNAPAALS